MTKASRDDRSQAQQAPQSQQPEPQSEEDLLDEALDETFPASDPIAVHPERDDDRKK